MADKNVQIKVRNGAVWDALFPKTKASLVEESVTQRFVSDTEKSTWNEKQAALGFTPENVANKGAANGYASLDALAKIPASQLPSYVDDVLEYTNLAAFPATGSVGIIYVTSDTNKTYRWSGSGYVVVSETIALGTTSGTAHRGDHGAAAYTHSQAAHAPSTAQKNSDITKAEIEAKLTGAITTHTHAASAPATHAGSHITGGSDIIPTAVPAVSSGLMSANDKTKLDGIAEGANYYTHPTTAGNKHIPAGGAEGQTLKYSADGTAQWRNDLVVSASEPGSPVMNDLWYEIIA